METLQSTSGFNSEASLSGRPHTPPYTPARIAKRRLERGDSPASTVGSIHPAETGSPAKKAPKTSVHDDIKVEELIEGDVGYMTDLDVVYPEELEEIGSSDSDTESDEGSDISDSEATKLTRKLSRLRCGDDQEVEFEQNRHSRHVTRRARARRFKRTHSQSVKGEGVGTDVPSDEHDHKSLGRRQRRRTVGPLEADVPFRGQTPVPLELSDDSTTPGTPVEVEVSEPSVDVSEPSVDDDMEVDHGT